MAKKYLFIICDGMGDLPVPILGNKTPLEAANTPNLDRLAKNGKTGLVHVLGQGIRPNSDEAHLTLFGYDLTKDYPGRGPIEAAGIGIVLEEGDVAIRANLATVDDTLKVIDRRAGRIENCADFVKDLDGIEIKGIKFLVKPGTGHRLALVMRGKGLSDKITNSDVHYVTEGKIVEDWQGLPVNVPQPTDASFEAKFTAEVLQEFLVKAHQILEQNPLNQQRQQLNEPKANYLLTRGPGYFKRLVSFDQKWGKKACCIAGAGLYKGLGRITGMQIIEVPEATGLPNTDIKAKIQAAKDQLPNFDFVFVHIKATDIFGENGDCQGKKAFIEKIDQAINHLEETKATICVTADHSTPCSHKDHSADAVPVLINGEGVVSDNQLFFGESLCTKGSIGEIEGKDLLKLLFAF